MTRLTCPKTSTEEARSKCCTLDSTKVARKLDNSPLSDRGRAPGPADRPALRRLAERPSPAASKRSTPACVVGAWTFTHVGGVSTAVCHPTGYVDSRNAGAECTAGTCGSERADSGRRHSRADVTARPDRLCGDGGLLRQPGGFASFVASPVLVAIHDLPVAHFPVRIGMGLNLDPAPPTSAPFAEGGEHILPVPPPVPRSRCRTFPPEMSRASVRGTSGQRADRARGLDAPPRDTTRPRDRACRATSRRHSRSFRWLCGRPRVPSSAIAYSSSPAALRAEAWSSQSHALMISLSWKRTRALQSESISTSLVAPRTWMRPSTTRFSTLPASFLNVESILGPRRSHVVPSALDAVAAPEDAARSFCALRKRRAPFGLGVPSVQEAPEVLPVPGLDYPRDHFHVLLRHRLLRQPRGFEGFVGVEVGPNEEVALPFRIFCSRSAIARLGCSAAAPAAHADSYRCQRLGRRGPGSPSTQGRPRRAAYVKVLEQLTDAPRVPDTTAALPTPGRHSTPDRLSSHHRLDVSAVVGVKIRLKISTFSCDIAYSDSPAAALLRAHSMMFREPSMIVPSSKTSVGTL